MIKNRSFNCGTWYCFLIFFPNFLNSYLTSHDHIRLACAWHLAVSASDSFVSTSSDVDRGMFFLLNMLKSYLMYLDSICLFTYCYCEIPSLVDGGRQDIDESLGMASTYITRAICEIQNVRGMDGGSHARNKLLEEPLCIAYFMNIT